MRVRRKVNVSMAAAVAICVVLALLCCFPAVGALSAAEQGSWKPYNPPCTERDPPAPPATGGGPAGNVFAFTEKPAVKNLGNDRYEITFAVKGNCDATVGIIDADGKVVRHLASGVLGSNAPEPFQRNSLKQTIYWDGKDDLGEYHKAPEQLKARVMLGLNPRFDKLVGCTHPKNLPGYVLGMTADPDGVYVFVRGIGGGHITVRQYGHDTDYVKTVWPPPANLPESKLGGMGYVEYEPGKRAVQAPFVNEGIFRTYWLPKGFHRLPCMRPVVVNGRLYMADDGSGIGFKLGSYYPVKLHYLKTDGSTEYEGLKGRLWSELTAPSLRACLAASPDGKYLYQVGFGGRDGKTVQPALQRLELSAGGKAEAIVGDLRNPGSDNSHLNDPLDVGCDGAGRVYVTDSLNNRVQVFSADGKHLKTVKADRPALIQVHRKTGKVYVSLRTRQKGESLGRLTRYSAFPAMAEEAHWDTAPIEVMALDSWSVKPRLWLSSEAMSRSGATLLGQSVATVGLNVYEDTGSELKKISDFDEDAAKAAGANYTGRWDGSLHNDLVCDPVREKVHYLFRATYDLKTGKFDGWFGGAQPKDPTTFVMRANETFHWGRVMRGGDISELAFDKRGYMHAHMAGSLPSEPPGKPVVRMDPDRLVPDESRSPAYAEVPYDYGTEWKASGQAWQGVVQVPPRCHLAFSWGMGVNMRGDIAVALDSNYTPKMEEEAMTEYTRADEERKGVPGLTVKDRYTEVMREMMEVEKTGGKMFFIRRRPGIPLLGATVWTYDRNGELRHEAGVVAGQWNNGVQIDEDGYVYFTNGRYAMKGDKPFLWNTGGNFGGEPFEEGNRLAFTGAFIKTRGSDVSFLLKKPPVPLPEEPKRPPDLSTTSWGSGYRYMGPDSWVWVEPAEWIYAGSSPIVYEHCHCYHMRSHLDWYKRSYVPEAYRHSVGIVDCNGNLITHVGAYGNFDSGNGPQSKVPVGGDGIATTMIRSVSGTDNYMCVADWGLRLIVAKLDYLAEETAGIGGKQPLRP